MAFSKGTNPGTSSRSIIAKLLVPGIVPPLVPEFFPDPIFLPLFCHARSAGHFNREIFRYKSRNRYKRRYKIIGVFTGLRYKQPQPLDPSVLVHVKQRYCLLQCKQCCMNFQVTTQKYYYIFVSSS